ncbi:cryptochrome/photolyase family protein [Kineococcus sp. R8]|uniref:cryptochrome/photolyase family protein n=1 Tax=Kineococcus siccus TaxID=2696567 RepID=UPI001412A44B|nr:cryptochrome/photolyase family protein [Kineococcus siccus]
MSAASDVSAQDLPERAPDTVRWLFADQLGPHFLDAPRQRVLLLESTDVFRRGRFHRRKAHLILSALRHRARDLGEQAQYVQAPTYREGLAAAGFPEGAGGLSVCDPTSYPARRFVRRLDAVELLASRGFVVSERQFAHWADARGAKRLLMEDFYREVRRHHGLLMDDEGRPVGGAWNYDEDNRSGPPKQESLDVAGPWFPREDDIDAQVREDLDRWERDEHVEFTGTDGPRRFAVTRREALTALRHFLAERLEQFGTYEDAMLTGDEWMSHSLLSATQNLGLLDPLEIARRAEAHGREHGTRLASVEGFVRQVVGWRSYTWHLYWYLGEEYKQRNAMQQHQPIPDWFADLDADAVDANCLSHVLAGVRDEGWVHHIPRLMVLGNWALQRGYRPSEVADWFWRNFVDGYDWVMTTNVVGMSQHADHGVLATKPYSSGGAYIDRMSDFCGGCRYDPKVRVGEDACPFTAGYWNFLHGHRELLAGNQRMTRALGGLDRLKDLDALLVQEAARGTAAP